MGQANAIRTQIQEGAYTLTSKDLANALIELDARITGADCWMTITRTSGLITQTNFYSDSGLTNLVMRKDYTYVVVDSIDRIATITWIFYNADTSEDSRVTKTLNRHAVADANNAKGDIEDCESPFTTTEETKL